MQVSALVHNWQVIPTVLTFQALPIYHEIGDRLGEAKCIRVLGDVHRMLAEYSQARERYAEALPIDCAIGHRLGEASSLSEKQALCQHKKHSRVELAADFGKTGTEQDVSKANCLLSDELRRAKTAPGRDTRYACA